MRSRYVCAALLGVVSLSAAGCGPSNTDNNTTGQPPAAAQTGGSSGGSTAGGSGGTGGKFAKQCPTSTAVGGLLGMSFPGDPRVTTDTGAIACAYTGTRTSDNKAEYVLLFMRTGTTTDMARTRQQEVEGGNSPVSQSGIGDEAYSFQTQSIRSTLTNLVVRKGDRVVQVGGEATMEQLTSLVNMLLGF